MYIHVFSGNLPQKEESAIQILYIAAWPWVQCCQFAYIRMYPHIQVRIDQFETNTLGSKTVLNVFYSLSVMQVGTCGGLLE